MILVPYRFQFINQSDEKEKLTALAVYLHPTVLCSQQYDSQRKNIDWSEPLHPLEHAAEGTLEMCKYIWVITVILCSMLLYADNAPIKTNRLQNKICFSYTQFSVVTPNLTSGTER